MKPNVLLLVIDSLRADKFYGPSKTSVTPNLDKLLEKGAYFSQAVSSAPSSIPAISSILTGLFPFASLYLENKVYNLRKDIPAIASELKKNGYVVYATIPKILTLMNLGHIFEENIESYDDNSTLYDGVGEKVLEKIDFLNKKNPWFYYLHLNDIHGQAIFHKDVVPDQFFDKKFGKNQYERMISLLDIWLGKIIEKIDESQTIIVLTSDHGSFTGIFDEEMDEMKKETREKLKVKKGFLVKIGQKITRRFPEKLYPLRRKLSQKYKERRDSIIEKRIAPTLKEIENQQLNPYRKRILRNMVKSTVEVYDDRFIVPLLFYGVGIPKNIIISQQVRNVDIFPTTFDVLELKIAGHIHGRSLLPLMNNEKIAESPAFLESHTNVLEGITSSFIGIRTSKFKYFRDKQESEKNIHLYNLENDPLEENNIASLNKQIILQMENLIKKIKNSI